eukprot:1195378-Pyramimonas_sp.AAC.1
MGRSLNVLRRKCSKIASLLMSSRWSDTMSTKCTTFFIGPSASASTGVKGRSSAGLVAPVSSSERIGQVSLCMVRFLTTVAAAIVAATRGAAGGGGRRAQGRSEPGGARAARPLSHNSSKPRKMRTMRCYHK